MLSLIKNTLRLPRINPVCVHFSSSADEPTPTKQNDSVLKKWVIVSPAVSKDQQVSRLVAGIEITPVSTTWAVLDTHKDEVVDCGNCPMFSAEGKVCSSLILDLSHKVSEAIPCSDLYVMEDKLWTKGNYKPHTDMGINLITFQAMLYLLLNKDYNSENPSQKVFYMQSKAIMKLFKLKAGNERASSQQIVQNMIKKSVVRYALENRWENIGSVEGMDDQYGHLKWTNPDLVKKIWTRDEVWRENVSNAILAAHAFTDLCLREDSEALRLLRKRGL